MISTIIAILAVDFNVFPRRFAKTETFGISIMDIGVGSFIVVNALTDKLKYKNEKKDENNYKKVKSFSILIILGLIRVALLKGIEYHEQISKYIYICIILYNIIIIML